MITGYALAVVLCILLLGLVLMLLRRRRLREKYAGIWIVVCLGVVALAAFPKFTFWLSDLARVSTPANLLFAVAIAVLLAVCIQLSTEVSTLEEETRTIAEELALLRLEVRAGRAADAAAGAPEPEFPAPQPSNGGLIEAMPWDLGYGSPAGHANGDEPATTPARRSPSDNPL